MGIIEVRGLRKSFGKTEIYKGLDLDVKKGEIISIIGGSGCGKSVLLRSIAMLEPPDSGQIFIDGQEITAKGANISKIRRSMGMVYQDFGLFSNMNVMKNLCIAPMKLLKMPKEEAEKKALELLASVGLVDQAEKPVHVLSGGQKQRIAICRCMMMDPQIILFDEPTSALDPTMVGEVLATIRMLSKRGLTMLIVTHEMNFARQIADRVLFLADGGIYEQGSPEDIFEHPKKQKTIDFVRKLKHMSYQIDRKDFDLMGLQGCILSFALKYGLSAQESYRLQICTEEMVYLLLDRVPDDAVDVQVNVSFSETDRACELEFTSAGEQFNPFELTEEEAGDSALSLAIIARKAKQYAHEYLDGVNRITLKM